jgi:glutamyl-tRNA reductase
VLVIGAGSMGEGVAVALHRAGGADILVANRTPTGAHRSPSVSTVSRSDSIG